MKYSAPSKIVLIGASTGGPGQIQKIVSALPPLQNATIIIAQHMARGFVPSFMKRIQEQTSNLVSMVEEGQALVSGTIYVCDGRTNAIEKNHSLFFSHTKSEENSYNPDIDALFLSFVPFVKNIEILGVILTGIGNDGVNGCKELSLSGCACLTETGQSAIVDGMPSRARQTVPNIRALSMQDIVKAIKEFCD